MSDRNEVAMGITRLKSGRCLETGVMGNAPGRDVYIIVPGSGMAIPSMRYLGAAISGRDADAKIVLVNPAGHGRSDALPDAADGTPYAEDYIRLAERLKEDGAGSVIIAGYSKGGSDQCKIAELISRGDCKKAVDGVVSIAGGAKIRPGDWVGAAAWELTPESARERLPDILELGFKGSNASERIKQEVIMQFAADNSSVSPGEFVKDLRVLSNTASDLSINKSMPMLFIAFREDEIMPIASIEESYNLLSSEMRQKSKIKIIDNAGHLDIYTHVDEIAGYIVDFKQEI